MQISVMSFNIQHCLNYRTRQIDFDLFAQVIRQSGADIVGLNEVNGRGAGADYLPQAEILAERLGFHAYFAQAIAFDGVNPYGNALLSRYSIETAQTILIPDPETRGYVDTNWRLCHASDRIKPRNRLHAPDPLCQRTTR